MTKRSLQLLRHFPWSPLLCFGFAWLVMQTGLMQQLAWKSLDWRTMLRAHFQPPPDPRIAVVLFADDTEMNLVAWPPDRAYHGALTELLSLAKPAVVTWDVILDASREGEGDDSMGHGVHAAMERGTKVVTGSVTNFDPVEIIAPETTGPTRPLRQITGDIGRLYGEDHALLPFPQLREAGLYGFVDAPHGADGIVRMLPLVVRVGGEVYASLALQTVLAYYDVEPEQVRVVLGDGIYLPAADKERRIPINASGMYFINYRYDQNLRFKSDGHGEEGSTGQDELRLDFPTESYGGILLKLNAHYVEQNPDWPPPPDLEGKVVFIGQTVTGKADAGPTPRSAYAPLVLVHANVVHNILTDDFAWRVPDAVIWSAMFLVGMGTVWIARKGTLFLMVASGVLVLAAYTNLAMWGWIFLSWWFPWVGPLLGFLLLESFVVGRRVWQEQKSKLAIKGMFGSYVSPEVVEQLVKADEPPHLGGRETEITAYFSDIQSFSSFSEQMSPKRLVELMNEYLTVCTDIVQEDGGTLDKYIGDAVVAMFGAPIAHPAHAYHACVASQRVQLRLAELREKWRAEGDAWPEIVTRMQSRIGLNTGPCIVGNMGSRTRFNYTMMGDNVNLAARMESGAKSWGVYTMCTEATRAACRQHGGDRVVFRPLGRIVVKGRAQPTDIFEIVGLKEHVPTSAHECIGLFEQALAHYYARDWERALQVLERCRALEINQPGVTPGVSSNPSLVYQQIIGHYREQPPPPDWTGVYVMHEK
ncbi:MAG: CHASE2 domain-containing protein [Opitutaceae bacterium]|nr:CHASE2 domain-containing protein [Opitutaceae bacterium]